MVRHDHPNAPSNQTYQARLARSLIETLGLEGAIYACQANAWAGVLDCVLAFREETAPRTG